VYNSCAIAASALWEDAALVGGARLFGSYGREGI
jgi:hypothetical protein